MQQMIQSEGLSKYYGPHQALDGLNFSIAPGEIVGFLGPNGAGKSTTMNILSGCLSLSEGRVRINGRDIWDEAREARASVGYLPEQPPLYSELTVREYLRHVCGLKCLPRSDWDAELERGMRMCSLEAVARRRIGHLSKGFRQRVGLAQALLGRPPLLILDEPTAGLDPQQILEIRKLIQQLGSCHTILFSSHILSEIEVVCQRVLILNQGRLVADDSTTGLRQKLNAESCRLELELIGPATALKRGCRREAAELLARLLDEQGIVEFSCTARPLGPAHPDQLLYRLDLQLPGSPAGSVGKAARPNTELSPGLGARSKLAAALATLQGFSVVAMVPQQRSLEEIFLSLTAAPHDAGTEPGTEPGRQGAADRKGGPV